jgi:hypothetical protein
MNVSKEDAGRALEIVGDASARMLTLKRYAGLAPFLLTWGSVWILANAVTDIAPGRSPLAWLAGSVVGVSVSVLLGVGLARRRGSQSGDGITHRRRVGQRFAMAGLAMCSFFPAMFTVLRPLTVRQENAFVSLCWAFLYMIAGTWIGWRLFAIGAIAAAATTFGYVAIDQHYYLWMALCGGGALIAGGLWLRTI